MNFSVKSSISKSSCLVYNPCLTAIYDTIKCEDDMYIYKHLFKSKPCFKLKKKKKLLLLLLFVFVLKFKTQLGLPFEGEIEFAEFTVNFKKIIQTLLHISKC